MRTRRFGSMDIDQTPWPIRSKARVLCHRRDRDEVEDRVQRIFGRPLEAWELAGLSGAPDEAVVRVGLSPAALVLEFRPARTDEYFARRLVFRDANGPVLADDGLHIFRATMHRHGLGLRISLRQVLHAKILKMQGIRAVATRGPYENGYYTWPRYGFDGPLPTKVVRSLPRILNHARSVLDLMETEYGRRWWQEYGTSLEVAFDLSPHSRSWLILRRYVAHRLHLILDDMIPMSPAVSSGPNLSPICQIPIASPTSMVTS